MMEPTSSANPNSGKPIQHTPAPRVLVTAGPTHEPIDRVRYIGNRSSGRMGIALTEACLARGWPVTLLLGPVADAGISPHLHSQLKVLRFQTAADLQALLHECWPAHDLLLMAAAVADYRVKEISGQTSELSANKIKRSGDGLTLQLAPTPDLLASLTSLTRAEQTIVGFALEPAATLTAEATRKLKAKGLDAIVANPLETMEAPDVTATLLFKDGRSLAAPPRLPKREFADWLIDRIVDANRQ